MDSDVGVYLVSYELGSKAMGRLGEKEFVEAWGRLKCVLLHPLLSFPFLSSPLTRPRSKRKPPKNHQSKPLSLSRQKDRHARRHGRPSAKVAHPVPHRARVLQEGVQVRVRPGSVRGSQGGWSVLFAFFQTLLSLLCRNIVWVWGADLRKVGLTMFLPTDRATGAYFPFFPTRPQLQVCKKRSSRPLFPFRFLTALAFWQTLLPPVFASSPSALASQASDGQPTMGLKEFGWWCEFLEGKGVKGVSKDVWTLVRSFLLPPPPLSLPFFLPPSSLYQKNDQTPDVFPLFLSLLSSFLCFWGNTLVRRVRRQDSGDVRDLRR